MKKKDHLRAVNNTTEGRTGLNEEPYGAKVTPHLNSFQTSKFDFDSKQ